jgi:hypothetical protein
MDSGIQRHRADFIFCEDNLMKFLTKYLLVTFALGASFTASADTFYCAETLIEEGMKQSEVQQHCGEPSSSSGYNWVYDRGPEKFVVHIHFEPDGTVGEIRQESSE